MAEPPIVQCKECGNLCVHNVDTGDLVPISRQLRNTGDPTDFEHQHCEAVPVCALGLVTFTGHNEAWIEEWEADRTCGQFVQHEPGLKLKDYTEMRLLETVTRENRKHRRITYALSIAAIIGGIISGILSAIFVQWLDG